MMREDRESNGAQFTSAGGSCYMQDDTDVQTGAAEPIQQGR